MTNFKQETYAAIKYSRHSLDDVLFIGSKDGRFRMSIKDFNLAGDFEYCQETATQDIATDLIVYFKDHCYLMRLDGDAEECWIYIEHLVYSDDDTHERINSAVDITGIFGDRGSFKTVADLYMKRVV